MATPQIGRVENKEYYSWMRVHHAYNNGGQKCWDLSSDITKTSNASPPTPNKVEFRAKWVKMSAFFGHNIAGGSGGDDGMNPKPNKKLSLEAESYGTIPLKGFFTQSQVLLSSIEGHFRACY